MLLIDDYCGAWSLDTSRLKCLSEQYELDFRIYGFERGMEFNHEFEVHKGTIIKDDEIKFTDYQWECPCPEMGG